MVSDPEHTSIDVPSELTATEAASAAKDAKPAGLTADTVLRSFNWGAFLIPVPWCLAMRQWVWAVGAAATPVAVIIGFVAPPGMRQQHSWEFIALGLIYSSLLVVYPLWLSVISGIGLVVITSGTGGAAFDVWDILAPLAYCLIPFAVSLYLGFVGNGLAARGRRFEDDWAFRFVQRRWADWGILAYVILLLLLILASLLLRA